MRVADMLYARLTWVAVGLTLIVVVVGAYVRLADAGLGCPDWPGCYGKLTPQQARGEIARAVAEQGGTHGPVSLGKAWKEMAHRYLAGALGLVILAIASLAWVRRSRLGQSPLLAAALLLLLLFQAALGMWTVTLLLKPVIVTLHLLGGMTILALLVWLALRQHPAICFADTTCVRRLRPWAVMGLGVLMVQISLGGWVSTNYAALACTDFPLCNGRWLPEMDFDHGFQLIRKLGVTAAGSELPPAALVAIHWSHRVGALITALWLFLLAVAVLRVPELERLGGMLIVLLLAQVGLGIANVLAGLPLLLAAAHNGVAALLLMVVVMLNFRLLPQPQR